MKNNDWAASLTSSLSLLKKTKALTLQADESNVGCITKL